MTDADNRMNTVHFGSDPADVRIPINSEIRIQIPEHSRLRFWHWRRFASSKYSLVFKRFKIIDGWVSAPDSLDTLVGQGRGRVR